MILINLTNYFKLNFIISSKIKNNCNDSRQSCHIFFLIEKQIEGTLFIFILVLMLIKNNMIF